MTEIREYIYSSSTEVISNAISFVNPFHGAVAKNARESHEMAQNVLNIAHLMAISIFRCNQPHPWKRYPLTVYYPDLYIYMAPGRV